MTKTKSQNVTPKTLGPIDLKAVVGGGTTVSNVLKTRHDTLLKTRHD